MGFPTVRMRRLRRNETIRAMVRESTLSTSDLIYPLFVVHGRGVRHEIEALPGNYHLSPDLLVEEVREVRDRGIPAVLLFGLPHRRDAEASEAYHPEGVVQRSVCMLKEAVPEMIVITDVCLCEYTTHGHCGVLHDGYLDNDASLELLRKVTLSHARAGADILAPAAMLDGQISTMRTALDQEGFPGVCIMGYSAKYASALYDPFFRHGTQSAVTFGDKKTHQMDFHNSDEAMREIALDIEEGADIVMVKPGMFYLDVVWRAKQRFDVPMAVYNVSGEYAMIKAAAQLGRLDERRVMLEVLTGFKRAGADLIITYFARQAAEALGR
ncbi:MAG: porphobilinogen synthase [Candidatus Latescibacterota bacterium]